MLQVRLNLRRYTSYRGTKLQEKSVTLGPYLRLERGYQGEMVGILPEIDGAGANKRETTFEASVGQGGYCETCAYDYPDFAYEERSPEYKRWEVVSIWIEEA